MATEFKEGDHVYTSDGLSGSIVGVNKDNAIVAVAVEKAGENGRTIATIDERTYSLDDVTTWTEQHEKDHVERGNEKFTFMHESAYKGLR